MAVSILLDTNVVLDLLMAREPFVHDAVLLFAMGEAGELELHLSTDAISTLFYILERNTNAATARRALVDLMGRVRLTPLLEETVRKGLSYDFVDVEDALVAAVAETAGTRAVVTRNTKDFANSPVPAVTPREFLAYWQASRRDGTTP